MGRVRRSAAVVIALLLVVTAEAASADHMYEEPEPVMLGAGAGSTAVSGFVKNTGRTVMLTLAAEDVWQEGSDLFVYQEKYRCRSAAAAARLVRNGFWGARGCSFSWSRRGRSRSSQPSQSHVPLHEASVDRPVRMRTRRPGEGLGDPEMVPLKATWTATGAPTAEPWPFFSAHPCGADLFGVASAYRTAESSLTVDGRRVGRYVGGVMAAGGGFGTGVWACLIG